MPSILCRILRAKWVKIFTFNYTFRQFYDIYQTWYDFNTEANALILSLIEISSEKVKPNKKSVYKNTNCLRRQNCDQIVLNQEKNIPFNIYQSIEWLWRFTNALLIINALNFSRIWKHIKWWIDFLIWGKARLRSMYLWNLSIDLLFCFWETLNKY